MMKDRGQNTITLKELVDFYIQQGMIKNVIVNTQEKEKLSPLLQEKIICSVRNEIQRSLTEEEASTIHRTAKAKQRQKEIQQVRTLLIEGVILAFFVGILVNLASEPLSTLSPIFKAIAAVICLIIIAALYFSRVLEQVQALLYPDQEGDSNPK